jgi:cell division protein FtsZ
VSEAAHPEANIIFGALVDESLEDAVWVTVVATGYNGQEAVRRPVSVSQSRLREPEGEPRVERRRPPEARRPAAALDVPEFMPRR